MIKCPHCDKELGIVQDMTPTTAPGYARFLATYINLDGNQMFFWADLPERKDGNES
jgi:hypothetical protein